MITMPSNRVNHKTTIITTAINNNNNNIDNNLDSLTL